MKPHIMTVLHQTAIWLPAASASQSSCRNKLLFIFPGDAKEYDAYPQSPLKYKIKKN